MGLFQMDGGASEKPVYEIGSPLFRKVTIQLDENYYPGGEFIIEARNVSGENRYIQSASLNGTALNKPWFYHEDLVNGGELVLEMGPIPAHTWGSAPSSAPPSLSSILPEKEKEEILAYDRTMNEIIFLGNSITDQAEWHEIFNNINVKNRGIGGDDTDGILERLDEVVSSKPSKIFLMIGTNDLAYGKSVDQIVENYTRILDVISLSSPETEIFVQSILPTEDAIHTSRQNADILAINHKIQVICEDREHVYIDLFSKFATIENTLNPDYSNDGLHLNGKGYLLWKSIVEVYINE
jgi:lysophospholipase L1-like esterase